MHSGKVPAQHDGYSECPSAQGAAGRPSMAAKLPGQSLHDLQPREQAHTGIYIYYIIFFCYVSLTETRPSSL